MTDLKLNYPTIDAEEIVLQNFITENKANFKNYLRFPNYQGSKDDILIASNWLNIDKFVSSKIIDIIVCNSANHSLSCLLQTLKHTHKCIITEPFTYPAFKTIALNNGFELVASDFDNKGLTLEGLEKCYAKTKAKLIYLQPTIHNPTCVVMPLERRIEIAEFARKNDILLIEDDAYRFLHPNPPLRLLDLIPENTFHIFSLSKPFNPFVKTAYLTTPVAFKNEIVDSLRLTSSGSSSLLSSLSAYILTNNRVDNIIAEKRALAIHLQKAITPIIKNLSFQTFDTSFHMWLKLPHGIKSDRIVNELLGKSIVIPNGKDFAVNNSTEKENFIRIALGAEKNIEKLQTAITEVVHAIG